MTTDKVAKLTVQVAEAAANISEAIVQPVIEATQGYRRHLEEAGFSPTIAEQMAAQYHVELIRVLFGSLTAGKK